MTFDARGSEEGKREGMARAERSADPHWWQCMLECGREVAEAKPYFFTDDIIALCQVLHPNASTHENRAIGPLMNTMARRGYCQKYPGHVKTARKNNHARPIQIWESLIYLGPPVARVKRPRPPPDPRQFELAPPVKPNFGNRLKLKCIS